MNQTKTRTRKSPEYRAAEILDAAVRLVLRDGVLKATMESIAKEAGVSKALVYTYFSNRTDLLQQALKREHQQHAEDQRDAIRNAGSFEEMAVATRKVNEAAQRPLLIERLKADPAIRGAVQELGVKGRADVLEYLSRTVSDHFSLPLPLAKTAIQLILDYDLSHETEIPASEIWGAMMQGAMLELERRYSKTKT